MCLKKYLSSIILFGLSSQTFTHFIHIERSKFCVKCDTYITRQSFQNTCQGKFLYRIDEQSGELKYDDELGRYIYFNVAGTYDSSFIGVICSKTEIEDIMGSNIKFSANANVYTGSYHSPVGGQTIVALSDIIKIN